MKYLLSTSIIGPCLVLLCMLLRATDVLFRSVTLTHIAPLELITLEHLVACLALLPFSIKWLRVPHLSLKEFLCLLFVGWGSSVGGIVCFTAAFDCMNPALVILLQKLQPVVTIFLSVFVLQERISNRFYFWSLSALAAAYVLAFGMRWPTAMLFQSSNFKGTCLALLAVVFWGSGTVFGKILLAKIDSFSLTQCRYYLGLLFAAFLLLATGKFSSLAITKNPSLMLNISYMALVPGFAALAAYYHGLRHTSAAIASILELFFPAASIVIAWVFLGQPLNALQIEAAAILVFSIVAISRLNLL